MDLREYLFRNRLKISDLAKKVNYTPNYISKILLGIYFPSKKLRALIFEITNGKVTVEDLQKNFDEMNLDKKKKK